MDAFDFIQCEEFYTETSEMDEALMAEFYGEAQSESTLS